MEFERLLQRYFDGSLSEPEVRRLQELLDRVPDYAHEFRQLLEVRSVLHDDALRLSPPPALTEPLHAVLERRFAALAPQDDAAPLALGFGADAAPVSPVRRRGVVRGVVGTLTAFMLAIGVALTPEIRLVVPMASNSAPVVRGVERGENSSLASLDNSVRSVRASRTVHEVTRRSSHAATNSVEPVSVVRVVEERTLPSVPDPDNSIAAVTPVTLPSATSPTLPSLGGGQGGGLLASGGNLLNMANAFPAPSAPKEINLGLPQAPGPVTGEERARTFNFGVVVASGQVAESPKPTAFMQNAYYLAFGLSTNDRLGVEAGFSNFRFDTRTAAPPPTNTAKVTGNTDGLARRTAGGNSGAGDNTSSDRNPGGSSGARTVELVTQRVEQTVNYGAVFYDRRVRLGKTWDLCGRVTVGGADQSLMGNVRAYVAYTPSSSGSFTITAGVGASGLYNMIARDRTVSGNVGLTYGIETGF